MTKYAKIVGPTMLWLAVGCGADDVTHFRGSGSLVPRTPIQRVPAPLAAAHCEIDVEGVGVIGMEDDYLPHVIHCENGGANLEALKAQAIAARSVAYYAIETSGGICDSQGCQVYSCGSEPEAIHQQAVDATSGQYLSYNDTLTYGFYVAGDSSVSGPGCVGVDGNAGTEHWITYNSGRSGTDVEQTELGFVHDPADNGYGQNRGCMGQWSARCLENDNGAEVTAILQFFYGEDIGIIQGSGDCVIPAAQESSGAPDPTLATGSGESSGADTLGGMDSSGATTMPASTTSAGEGDSMGETASDPTVTTSAGDEGTAAGEGAALPDTFGENGEASDGCGCSSPAGDANLAAALGLFVLACGRRRSRG